MKKITLPLPPSINATYKMGKGKFYKDSKVRAWENEVMWLIKSQWKGKPLTTKVRLDIYFFFGRERDISGGLKVLEDVLQTAGIYVNDSQIYEEHIFKAFDKPNIRVEILIQECLL